MRVGRLVYDGFFVMWDGFWIVCLSNLLWLALLIPVVTIPLAFAGLYACAHGLAHGESLEWQSFFIGIKKHFGASVRWAGANLLVFSILAFYVWFFSAKNNPAGIRGSTLVSVSLVLGLLWWILNMFTFPFMLVQQEASYLSALRNSLVLFLKWPAQAIGFTILIFAVIALSLWLRFPWLLWGASLPALMACLCVKDVVDQIHDAGPVKS
jgi:hypothetical protein